MEWAKSDRAPRGQSSVPATTPIAAPTAISSTLTNPTCQPPGASKLKRTINRTVNAVWPATKDSAEGVYAARNTATGEAAQSTTWSSANNNAKSPPTAKPSTVPANACTAVRPVANAFDRSTDIV